MIALLACGIIVFTLFIRGPEDKVVFLDVGQGDAILLQSGAHQVLVDGGPGATVLERLGEELPFFDKTLDVLVLTHPQRDHMEGLLHVLEHYDVGLVVLPRVAHTSQLQDVWLQKIIERSVPYRFAWAGERLQVGDMTVVVLGPFATPAAAAAIRSDLNNASVITRVDLCPERTCLSFLLTGDAERPAEALLVSLTPPALLDVDVLKAGHHGSNSSTHEPLVRAAHPRAAVISVGADNQFGHPHPTTLARLQGLPLWRTDEDGSIRFVWSGGQWLVTTSR